ncbi:MAG: hypothetical protein N3A60_00105 [Thermanaerothrix sp.]|nr:hypothetical protein [Thermanaerothrix sp.]
MTDKKPVFYAVYPWSPGKWVVNFGTTEEEDPGVLEKGVVRGVALVDFDWTQFLIPAGESPRRAVELALQAGHLTLTAKNDVFRVVKIYPSQ